MLEKNLSTLDIEFSLDENIIKQEISSLINEDLESKLDSNQRFCKYSRIYSFATENLRGYIGEVTGKKVLTVSASGDQIINAYYHGAENVCAFDINLLSAFFSELKLSAVCCFEYDEFKEFFLRQDDQGNINKNALSYETYGKIRNDLSELTKYFFDSMYEINAYSGSLLRESAIFNNKYDSNDLKIMSNSYMQSEETYNYAKNSVKNKKTKWVLSSLDNLCENLRSDQQFDTILLSNIADYANLIYEGEKYLEKFFDFIFEELSGYVVPNGKICAAYIYATNNSNPPYRTDIDDPTKRQKVFNCQNMPENNLNYSEIEFESVMAGRKDSVLVLTKN